MGALRDRMLANMRLNNLSPRTIEAYLWHMTEFTKYFRKAPDLLGEEEVQQYLLYLLEERKVSWSNINVGYSALKYFYVKTLYRDWQIHKIPRPKGERRLPVVLSSRELQKLFSVIRNKKHLVILKTIYSAGLRIGEATHLKIHHIEKDSMRIRVEQGKGRKDRYTLLSEKVLEDLRDYWRTYRPSNWLFCGRDKNKPLSVSAIQAAFRKAKKKPALTNKPLFIPCVTVLQHIFWNRALTFSQ